MTRLHRLNLSGQKYGRWTALRISHRNAGGEVFWICRCDCGVGRAVKAGSLRNGRSTSCGCYHREAVSDHGMTKTPTFKSWDGMRQRCTNPKTRDYRHYGGKGIAVCERWANSFDAFLSDMGERPLGMSLDRIDGSKGYEPGNCRWATATTQIRNRSNTRRAIVDGVSKTLAEWAELRGATPKLFSERLDRGWTPERAINTPVMEKYRSR